MVNGKRFYQTTRYICLLFVISSFLFPFTSVVADQGVESSPATYYLVTREGGSGIAQAAGDVAGIKPLTPLSGAQNEENRYAFQADASSASALINDLFREKAIDSAAVPLWSSPTGERGTLVAISREIFEDLANLQEGSYQNTVALRLPILADDSSLKTVDLELVPYDIVSPDVVRLKTDSSGESVPDDGYKLLPFVSPNPDDDGAFVLTSYASMDKPLKMRGYFSVKQKRYALREPNSSSKELFCADECVLVAVTEMTNQAAEQGSLAEGIKDTLDVTEPDFDQVIKKLGLSEEEAADLERPAQAADNSSQAAANGSCREAEIATEADWEFYRDNGGNSDDANMEIILNLISVDQVTRNQLDLKLTVVLQHTWTDSNDPYDKIPLEETLDQFQFYWQLNFGSFYDYDLAHMFSGRAYPGASGMAWRGQTCDILRYGISSMFAAIDDRTNTVLHEIGHTLGADHDFDCEYFPYIMCYAISIFEYSPESISDINFALEETGTCLSSTSCWTDPSPPPGVPNIYATRGTESHIKVDWEPINGFGSGYSILRSENSSGPWSPVGVSAVPFFRDDTVSTPNSNYWYRVITHRFGLPGQTSPATYGYFVNSPNNPRYLQASDGEYPDYVQLTWEGPAGGIAYDVYRATNHSPCSNYLGEITSTTSAGVTYLDYSALRDITYYYSVKQRSSGGCSSIDLGYVPALTLPAVENIQASDGTYSDEVRLTWNRVPGAIDYTVYRAYKSSDVPCSVKHTVLYNSTNYNDTHVIPGDKYYYSVRAFGRSGAVGRCSIIDPGYPAMTPPTNVQASDGTYADRVRISWQPTVGNEDHYEIFRSTSNSACSSPLDITDFQNYDDLSASAGVTYYYSVKSVSGDSVVSNCSSINSGYRAQSVSPPTNVQATDGTYASKVRITWSAASGAVSYKLYRSTTNSACSSTLVTTITGTSYDDTSATPGVTYYYSLKSRNAGGAFSSCSSVNSGYKQMSTPSGVSATDGIYTSKVKIAWNSVSGAASYNLYRSTSDSACSSILVTTVTGTSYDDTSAIAGRGYYYSVKARGANGFWGSCSSTNKGYRKLLPPSNVAASDSTYRDKIRVTWSSASGAVSNYRVYRSTSNVGCSYLLKSNANGTSYNDYTATPGVTYYYSMKSKGENGSLSNCSPTNAGRRRP